MMGIQEAKGTKTTVVDDMFSQKLASVSYGTNDRMHGFVSVLSIDRGNAEELVFRSAGVRFEDHNITQNCSRTNNPPPPPRETPERISNENSSQKRVEPEKLRQSGDSPIRETGSDAQLFFGLLVELFGLLSGWGWRLGHYRTVIHENPTSSLQQ